MKMKIKKLFNNWLKKEMEWIFKPTVYPSYDETFFNCCLRCASDLTKVGYYKGGWCLHSVEGGNDNFLLQNEKKRYLIEAYSIAMQAKSFKEIKQRKNENRNWYWSYLKLKDWQCFSKQLNEKTKNQT